MSVKVDITVEADPMADMMVYNIYTSKIGITAILLGVLNVGLTMAFVKRGEFLLVILFALFAALILLVFPYLIRQRVHKKMKNSGSLGEVVTYEFTDDGITTTTSTDSGKASWGKFKKAISRKYIIVLYDHAKQTIVLPIHQLGEQYTEVVDMICEHMPVTAVRIRRIDQKKE